MNSQPNDTVETINTTIRDGIRRGEHTETLQYAKQHETEHAQSNFVFLLNMRNLYLLTGDYQTAVHYLTRADDHPDHDPIVRGDYHREAAQAFCDMSDRTSSGVELHLARRLHKGDLNRLAALNSIDGRRSFGAGELRTARRLFQKAHRQWRDAGDAANPQWVERNQFYWMRTLVDMKERRKSKSLLDTLTKSPSRRLRISAQVIWRLGPLGNRLYRSIVKG